MNSEIGWNTLLWEAFIQRCYVKKVFLEFPQNLQENTCARVSFQCLRSATLLKNRRWHKCLPVNFAKFLRIPFFIEHLWWLLLYNHLLPMVITVRSSNFMKYRELRMTNPIWVIYVNRALLVKPKKPATFFKIRLWYRCFPVTFAKFLRTTFL